MFLCMSVFLCVGVYMSIKVSVEVRGNNYHKTGVTGGCEMSQGARKQTLHLYRSIKSLNP